MNKPYCLPSNILCEYVCVLAACWWGDDAAAAAVVWNVFDEKRIICKEFMNMFEFYDNNTKPQQKALELITE